MLVRPANPSLHGNRQRGSELIMLPDLSEPILFRLILEVSIGPIHGHCGTDLNLVLPVSGFHNDSVIPVDLHTPEDDTLVLAGDETELSRDDGDLEACTSPNFCSPFTSSTVYQ